MMSLAAKAALKEGLRRQDATMAFMAAFDTERERPQGPCCPPPIVKPAIKRISSMRPPTEEPIK